MNRNSNNAWATNPLQTRKDVAQALEQQIILLIPAFTEGSARPSLADTSALLIWSLQS